MSDGTFEDSNIISIYDINKRLLNRVDCEMYGIDRSDDLCIDIRFEKKICIFHDKITPVNGGDDKPKHECKLLEIDLTTGDVNFDNDFKYFIENVTTTAIYYEGKYQYTRLVYQKLNEKNQVEDYCLCSFAKEGLSFDNSFLVERFNLDVIREIYKLGDKNFLCSNDRSELFVCNERERNHVDGIKINDITFVAGDRLIFNKNGKKYLCDRDYFYGYSKRLTEGYDALYAIRFSGDFVFANRDEEDSDFYDYAGFKVEEKYFIYLYIYGLCVVDEGIWNTKGELLVDATEKNGIYEFDGVDYVGHLSLFKIRFGDGSYKSFYVIRNIIE